MNKFYVLIFLITSLFLISSFAAEEKAQEVARQPVPSQDSFSALAESMKKLKEWENTDEFKKAQENMKAHMRLNPDSYPQQKDTMPAH